MKIIADRDQILNLGAAKFGHHGRPTWFVEKHALTERCGWLLCRVTRLKRFIPPWYIYHLKEQKILHQEMAVRLLLAMDKYQKNCINYFTSLFQNDLLFWHQADSAHVVVASLLFRLMVRVFWLVVFELCDLRFSVPIQFDSGKSGLGKMAPRVPKSWKQHALQSF